MLMQEDSTLQNFDILLENFKKTTKRVLQTRPVSKNRDKIDEYIHLICDTYNKLIRFIGNNRTCIPASSLSKLTKQIAVCKLKVKNCGIKLNYSFEFDANHGLLLYPEEFFDATDGATLKLTSSLPDNLHLLHVKPESRKVLSCSELSHQSEDIINLDVVKDELNLNCIDSENLTIVTTILNSIIENCVRPEVQNFHSNSTYCAIHTMASATDKRTFIGMCASIIRENYDGDPLELESFIDKIALVEELADEELLPTLMRFVISKLSGKARESVPNNLSSINDLKVSLRERIKPDNSKVVAGKIASVQVVNNNYAEFSKEVEELADALERSLVVEGITKPKAHEMAVEQTVQTCRANAKSDLVKSILASSKFSDPKDVVAKLIIEQSNEIQEKQVLRFNNLNRQNSNNNRWVYQHDSHYNNYNSRYRNSDNYFNNNRSNYRYNHRNNSYNNNIRNNFNHNNQHSNNFQNSQTSNNGANNNRINNSRNNSQNSRYNQYTSQQQQQRNSNSNNIVTVRTLNAEGHQEVVQELPQN